MNTESYEDWIAVDWGASNLRAYAMQGSTIVRRARSDKGLLGLAGTGFEAALEEVLEGWNLPELPVIACGMVGARQGWTEAPYRFVPCAPLDGTPTRIPTKGNRAVYVISGLAQRSPADVMRGEETQITGFLALNRGWDGVLCLPGTHTKWVLLSAGEVVSFQSFMTGELFALLSGASVLKHTVNTDEWSDTAFIQAVEDALAKPERLAARLFSLRATDLLDGHAPGAAAATLSGFLIGAELAATRPYWLGQSIAVLGTDHLSRAYQAALAQVGNTAMIVDGERATVAGLAAAYAMTKPPK